VAGDTGHCSQCPDNQFCEGGRLRRARAPSPRITPPPSPKPSAPTGGLPAGPLVAQVIGGDTLRLPSGERVRIIGVNAPERKEAIRFDGDQVPQGHPGWPEGSPGGGDRAKGSLYGRLLAHVWTAGGLYVNAELLRRGCAKLMVIGANVSHLYQLVKAQEEARIAGRGVWGP